MSLAQKRPLMKQQFLPYFRIKLPKLLPTPDSEGEEGH